ncbi:PilN domain-containing protein [Succinimonas sp.]|uniref:PilN domain-containing protein n=1 Tax=Succinimonas sp. TaxID=1936151 RepID=UPI00386C8243
MSNINLLPWRQQLKKKSKDAFIKILVGFFLVGVSIVVLGYLWLSFEINTQQGRNKEFKEQIAQLDQQIAEIAKLKERRQELIDRMKAIETLQQNRNIAVHLFSDLPTLVASGVYLDSMKFDQRTAQVKGMAESNPRVSSMLRNIDNSKWLGQSNITETKAEMQNGQRKLPTLPDGLYNFVMSFKVVDSTDALNAGNNGGTK